MKKKNAVALGLFLTMAMSMPASAIDCTKITRIEGRERVETSLKSAETVNSDVLVLASAYSYADSLSASNVVLKTGGKLVLVGNNTDVKSLFKNHNIKKIYLIGGENSLSKYVEENAKKLCNDVVRLSGSDRYVTNEKTLSEFGLKDVGVADGTNYPDALSASSLLKDKNLGLLLVNGIKPYRTNYNVKYTFGYSVKQDGGKRLAGKNRYETNLAVLRELGKKDTIAIASGEKFPDALSAINLVTSKNASVALLRNEKVNINKELKDYIGKAKEGYILGGTSTLSNDVVKNITCDKPLSTGGGSSSSSSSSSKPIVNEDTKVREAFNKEINSSLKKIELPEGVAKLNDGENNTTKIVNILDLSKPITSISGTGAMVQLNELLKKDVDGYKLVSYKIDNQNKVDLTDNEKLPEEILKSFIETLGIEDANVKIGDFVGKTISAEVIYKKDNKEIKDKYTVKFTTTPEAIQNNFDKEVGKILDAKEIKIPEKVGTYAYDKENRTATLTVKDRNQGISSLSGTGLIVALDKLVENDSLYSYKLKGMEEAREVKNISQEDLKNKIVEDIANSLNLTLEDTTLGKIMDKVGEEGLVADIVVKKGEVESTAKYTLKFVEDNNKTVDKSVSESPELTKIDDDKKNEEIKRIRKEQDNYIKDVEKYFVQQKNQNKNDVFMYKIIPGEDTVEVGIGETGKNIETGNVLHLLKLKGTGSKTVVNKLNETPNMSKFAIYNSKDEIPEDKSKLESSPIDSLKEGIKKFGDLIGKTKYFLIESVFGEKGQETKDYRVFTVNFTDRFYDIYNEIKDDFKK